MDFRLELIVVPVSDVDRAKAFYVDQAGFHCDVDHETENFRVVQLTPPGSGCSISLMRNDEAAGSLQGLHLVVTDVVAAREELLGRGMEVSEPFHFSEAGETPGLPAVRSDFATYATFIDPDGTGWLLQEVPSRG